MRIHAHGLGEDIFDLCNCIAANIAFINGCNFCQ